LDVLLKKVNWVISMDCPENKEEYIHRIGRTGRNEKNGKSLLFLTPTKGLKIISFHSLSFHKIRNGILETVKSKTGK